MLPSSQVNTNPFESIPNDPSRTATPTPYPNDSSAALSLQTPAFPTLEALILSAAQTPDPPSFASTTRPPSRSLSSTFVSSPLNPNSTTSPYAFARPRPVSRASVHISRVASEDAQALGSQLSTSRRGSMVLWRLASADDQGALLPPTIPTVDQSTFVEPTTSGESIWTHSSDSKYPSGPPTGMRGGLVPYAWDPSVDDDQDGPDEEDDLHHRSDSADKPSAFRNARGILNVGVLVLLIGGLLVLFIGFPVMNYMEDNSNFFFFEGPDTNTVNVSQ